MKTTIQTQFFVYYLFLSVIPLLALSYYSYASIKTNAEQELVNTISFDVRQSQSSLDNLYTRFQKYTDIISNSTTFYNSVISIASDIQTGNMQQAIYTGAMNLDPQIKSLFATDDDIAAALVVIDGRPVYSYKDFISINNHFDQNPIIANTINTPNMHWFSSQSNPFGLFDGEYTVITKNVYDIMGYNPKESLCQFIILVRQQRITDILNSHLRLADSMVSVMDDSHTIIASNMDGTAASSARFRDITNRIPSGRSGQDTQYIGRYLVLQSFSNVSSWHIIQLSPSRLVTKASSSIILFTVVLIISLLLVMFLFSYFISKEIILPIKRLAHAMKKVGEKNIVISIAKHSRNEIGEIINGFNQMVRRIDNLFKLTIEIEGQKRKSEIDMLKYQINPHFLYNTINSIRFSAMNHQDEVTAGMLVTLSRLLRNTLSHSDLAIQLQQEIQNIDDYIQLQQLRYNNLLHVEYRIDDQTRFLYVPHMILQPIVENAILHGLSQKLNSGEYAGIVISSQLTDNFIHVISVYDNGIGIPNAMLERILEQDASTIVSDSLHIGLVNIHKRIRLQYGEPYGIELESAEGLYANVRIVLPVLKHIDDTVPISFEQLEKNYT
ncbi:sensor histidine kinase [Paenibacillus protaetiae]|uniref:HAMP domain-containing protein n=1 Tax=Paenibacillus protaetiae TaxID=2509456 RepID=A0A4V0YF99_9BACL|nr:histidine kinase [Paenibacillus protaetiae]QAY66971.1 HAMP domain-containing protein [Paenibacillus protaetiae]